MNDVSDLLFVKREGNSAEFRMDWIVRVRILGIFISARAGKYTRDIVFITLTLDLAVRGCNTGNDSDFLVKFRKCSAKGESSSE